MNTENTAPPRYGGYYCMSCAATPFASVDALVAHKTVVHGDTMPGSRSTRATPAQPAAEATPRANPARNAAPSTPIPIYRGTCRFARRERCAGGNGDEYQCYEPRLGNIPT
jgi:hypothetical protein